MLLTSNDVSCLTAWTPSNKCKICTSVCAAQVRQNWLCMQETANMFWPVVTASMTASAISFAMVYGYYRYWPNRRHKRRVKDMAAMRDLLVHHMDDLDEIMDKLHIRAGNPMPLSVVGLACIKCQDCLAVLCSQAWMLVFAKQSTIFGFVALSHCCAVCSCALPRHCLFIAVNSRHALSVAASQACSVVLQTLAKRSFASWSAMLCLTLPMMRLICCIESLTRTGMAS